MISTAFLPFTLQGGSNGPSGGLLCTARGSHPIDGGAGEAAEVVWGPIESPTWTIACRAFLLPMKKASFFKTSGTLTSLHPLRS